MTRLNDDAAVIRDGILMQCHGCKYDEGHRITVSPECALHGEATAALEALNRLVAVGKRHKALVRRFDRLREAVEHVIADSPGTPDSVKRFLGEALRG